MFAEKKPRFHLNLAINELSNIPQIQGYCYLELYIRNSSSKSHWFSSSAGHLSSQLKKEHKGLTGKTLSGNHIHVATAKKKIHNFRCAFHENISCNLKFPVKKSQNLIGNKYLSLRVFYVPHHDLSDATVIGRLEVNLSEYLNFSGTKTLKYLLKDSKVNLILSISIALLEMDPQQDFHTLLQLTTSKTTPMAASSSVKLGNHSATTQFNIPEFDRKNVFGGLNNVIIAESPTLSKRLVHSNDSSLEHDSKTNKMAAKKLQARQEGQNASQDSEAVFTMDPVVQSLYKKVLESTWDPQLHPLLEYSPEKCINDIFDGTQTPAEHFQDLSDLEDDEVYRNMNGLISETRLRDDLRSWSVAPKKQAAH